MSIWEYANPKRFMETSGYVLPWLTALATALLGGEIGRAHV
jgi:heme exporter protein C